MQWDAVQRSRPLPGLAAKTVFALKSHHEAKPLRNLSSMGEVNVMQE